jgi:hypothetical protein
VIESSAVAPQMNSEPAEEGARSLVSSRNLMNVIKSKSSML